MIACWGSTQSRNSRRTEGFRGVFFWLAQDFIVFGFLLDFTCVVGDCEDWKVPERSRGRSWGQRHGIMNEKGVESNTRVRRTKDDVRAAESNEDGGIWKCWGYGRYTADGGKPEQWRFGATEPHKVEGWWWWQVLRQCLISKRKAASSQKKQ